MKKSNIIFPSIALVIGYLIGSLVFPLASSTDTPSDEPEVDYSPPSISRPSGGDTEPQPRPIPNVSNNNPRPPRQLSGNATPPESIEKAEQAKWLRLIEVLGLDSDQAKALEAAIAEIHPKPDDDTTLDVAYAEAGERLEQAILAMLTPEQQAAFREMQQRTLENRVEVKAQEEFSESLAKLDLTAAQREQALELLRIQAEEKASAISSGTRLLLGGSFLPIGDEKTTDKSFELMGQLQLKPGEDPPTFEQIAAVHRAELERRMTQFEGILTPAQLALYQSSLAQGLENLDVISPQR
ncbi:MAG: hypothetical protein NWT08_07000 [Akkermansiaceae bacterium]|jgi:hypothetical protein|nr:hypothetical protein [Akkermansiaceae bacterium]MDP4647341.1 hypothetical protein [Akkermansiaceae bacterium]MDP4720146.1 hypothetical protein [Akkermansiaceae bacterium]MDP4779493.1 hypothetical protein [Akkermansiaceae bacterium]MDP4847311.1 hypothetical protein [Akkermansiaceae bacterium]